MDRSHIIESRIVQDTTHRLTRIDLRPRFDDLAIFIKRDALSSISPDRMTEVGAGVRKLACLRSVTRASTLSTSMDAISSSFSS